MFMLPPMIHGSSPFFGAAQFGDKAYEYYERFYRNPEKMADLFIHFARKAYPWVHIIPYYPLVQAVEIAEKEVELNTVVTVDMEYQMEDVSDLNPPYVFLHASKADSLKKDVINDFLDLVRDVGSKPGIATHNPGRVITDAELYFPDIEAYLCPVNPLGIYMSPGIDSALDAIRLAKSNGKKIFGMKVLAAGKLKPKDAFRFAKKYCDTFVVGFVKKDEIDEAVQEIKKLME
jgi:pentose-5-phosphate-3-epimerase